MAETGGKGFKWILRALKQRLRDLHSTPVKGRVLSLLQVKEAGNSMTATKKKKKKREREKKKKDPCLSLVLDFIESIDKFGEN